MSEEELGPISLDEIKNVKLDTKIQTEPMPFAGENLDANKFTQMVQIRERIHDLRQLSDPVQQGIVNSEKSISELYQRIKEIEQQLSLPDLGKVDVVKLLPEETLQERTQLRDELDQLVELLTLTEQQRRQYEATYADFRIRLTGLNEKLEATMTKKEDLTTVEPMVHTKLNQDGTVK